MLMSLGLWALACGSSSGQKAVDYLPNQAGNEWTYEVKGRLGGGDSRIEVERRFGGWAYFAGLPGAGDRWLWASEISARSWVWNPATGTIHLWLDLGGPKGSSINVAAGAGLGCWDGSEYVVAEENATHRSAVGTFNNCVVIRLERSLCADAGITRMVFALGVGLVEYEEQTIAGPRVHCLTHALVDGEEYKSAPQALVSCLSIDRYSYTQFYPGVPGAAPQADTMRVTLSIENNTQEDIGYTYFSGQTYDIDIYDENGAEVYRWSFGKAFTEPVIIRELQQGGGISFSEEVELRDNNGQLLRGGIYQVRMVHQGRGLSSEGTTQFKIEELFAP